MKTNKTAYKSAVRPALATAFILLLSLLAMQISDEVVWSLSHFVIFGALLFGTGFTYQLVVRKMGSVAYKFAVGLALASAFILVWLMGAVGVIGVEGDPFDLIYFGVILIGIVGAIIARFQPQGMARAMFVTAFAQALVVVIALMAGKHHSPVSSVAEIVLLNGFFVAMLQGSAKLFQNAAREQPNAAAGKAD